MSTILLEIQVEAEVGSSLAAHGTREGIASALPTGSAARSAGVRLTRRGRLLLLLAGLAVAFSVLTLISGPAASTAQEHHAPTHTVVVEPGQTLWEIASAAAPSRDPREVVAEIVDLNALTDPGSIRVGQPLDVPAR